MGLDMCQEKKCDTYYAFNDLKDVNQYFFIFSNVIDALSHIHANWYWVVFHCYRIHFDAIYRHSENLQMMEANIWTLSKHFLLTLWTYYYNWKDYYFEMYNNIY